MTVTSSHSSERDWPAVERRKPGWAADWQATVERDKASLARTLHDETGGLLVAAVMDVTWAEGHLDHPDATARLARARATLDQAIELNRRIIEELRPTLLENFGLVPALRWYFAETCKAAKIHCRQHLPELSAEFTSVAAISMYRIAETLVAVMIDQRAPSLEMLLGVNDGLVTLTISAADMPEKFSREDDNTINAVASVVGRAKALGGDVVVDAGLDTAFVSCRLPVARVVTDPMT